MSQTNILPSTMPLLQLETHDRDRDAFHCRLSVCQPYKTTIFHSSVSHKHKQYTNTTEGQIFNIFWLVIRFFVVTLQFLLSSLFQQSGLVVISWGEALPFGMVIHQRCGGISEPMGVTDLFDLDFFFYINVRVDVTLLLGGVMCTTVRLF